MVGENIMPRPSLHFAFLAPFLILALASIAAAETVFVAQLNGAHVTPANNSAGNGFAVVVVNDAGDQVRVRVKFSALGSQNSVGHIHGGSAGESGPVLFSLIFGNAPGTGNENQSQSFIVTPSQVQQLRNGQWYFDIHSANFPNGEIRGQAQAYSPFVAHLSSAQVVPSFNSNAQGYAAIVLNQAETEALIFWRYTGLSADQAVVKMPGPAPAGINTSNGFTFIANQGQSAAFTSFYQTLLPSHVQALKAGQYCLTVGNPTSFPDGEIRGQFKALNRSVDFDADGRADIAVIRGESPGQGTTWYWLNSTNNQFNALALGDGEERYVPADYDGDGLTDPAVWLFTTNPAPFQVLLSSTHTVVVQPWGDPATDKPVPADYDGDGKADFAVYRHGPTNESPNYFFILGSNGNQLRVVPWGKGNDVPIVADFDGDRVADPTVVREEAGRNVFYSLLSTDGSLRGVQWGRSVDDYPMVGDFNGDGRSDYASYVANGVNGGNPGDWWILDSDNQVTHAAWGLGSDVPVPADYDGDGKTDLAIWRGVWWIRQSSDNAIRPVYFGLNTDTPVNAVGQ
jgi:hypothetical protein